MVTELQEDEILSSIPDKLRMELLSSFKNIQRNFKEGRWEPSELNGGKLCEVVYTILRGYVDGVFPSKSSKPKNMVDACRSLEKSSSLVSRSVRIQIPRMLIALYEIRNNRGVGHVGGDVDPNHMDAIAVLYMCKWILAELIRIFHKIDIETASKAVEIIIDRTLPIVWQVGNMKRILKTDLTMREKSLVLLYHINAPIPEASLVSWIEHSNPSVYRRDVLRKLHKEKLIEYNENQRTGLISPIGIRFVEENINLDI